MPSTTEIACEDCGFVIQAARRNTKYCRVCRMVRDLPYVATRHRKCGLCDTKFHPINVRDACCGEHAPRLAADELVTCAYCGTEGLSVAGDLAVCRTCARTSGELRQRFFKALLNRQRKQQATEYPPPAPYVAPVPAHIGEEPAI